MENYENLLEQARAERDVVTKRMIELEQEVAKLRRSQVVLPCPIGSDCWWVSSETLEVECEKGGITGFVVLKDKVLALDAAGERVEIHSQWCCLSREEAEAMRERLLKESKA